eukprot:Trichotokara_eunicae@DN5026_c0_g1_i10.p1
MILNSLSVTPTRGFNGPVCVFLHGLLGSAYNFSSMMKRLSASHVYSLDLRNHASSGRKKGMTISDLSHDVHETLKKKLNVSRAILIGHSLGGKVAMSHALQYPRNVGGLVVLDSLPVDYKSIGMPRNLDGLSTKDLLKHLSKVDLKMCKTSEDVRYSIVAEYPGIGEAMLDFLTSRLLETEDGGLAWPFELRNIRDGIDDCVGWPEENIGASSDTQALFLVGKRSEWTKPKHWSSIYKYFTNARVKSLDAGHWIHSEQPNEVVRCINKFIEKDDTWRV